MSLTSDILAWLLFIAAGVVYCVDAALQQAWLYLAGSVLWTVACIVFLVPLLQNRNTLAHNK
eukprot:CAMPEP_0206055130 /NCGR_PEP_ID=MMETSP1466-20131121/39487_1 /ASSEMBLY_ACC=CAM_ASM_001126 /TAXON_ID=44452 /ORGANISM="Pavlova gyrans, Strain CCMP608" /LENGTH=61 /DNA_ID=CAMNT_0053430353 /DNA_START=21 /DNA_END=206 /DNA_ORIENTATION=-